jgi:hypothetical protein
VQRLVHPLEPLLVRADVGEHPTVSARARWVLTTKP